MSLYLPGAAWRPISYRSAAGAFTSAPLGWILHTAVMNGSPFGVFAGAVSPNRRFSHGWVAKDGSAEQYQTLDMKSWAQAAGNGSYWAFETEGYPGEPLTPAQIETLARWHVFLGAANQLAEKPGDRGIGTHYMGGSAWGGHTCPDATPGAGPRSHQRVDILAAAAPVGHGGSDAPTPRPAPAPDPAPAPKPAPAPAPTGRLAEDGVLGPNTIKALQRWVGVTADGVMGPQTIRALQRKLGTPQDGVISKPSVMVRALQRLVGAGQDGYWGTDTTRHLQHYLNKIGA